MLCMGNVGQYAALPAIAFGGYFSPFFVNVNRRNIRGPPVGGNFGCFIRFFEYKSKARSDFRGAGFENQRAYVVWTRSFIWI